MGQHFGIVAILSIIFLAPSIVEGQEVVLTCGDECVDNEPIQKTTIIYLENIVPEENPAPCPVTVTWNEAEVCALEGGGCVFELVSIEYPDNCAYEPEDVVYYGLLGFLLSQVGNGCLQLGPDDCVENVRLYTGQCAKRVYTNGNWKILPCYEFLSSPCCKSVYKICKVNFRWQLQRTGYYSPTPECFSFGMPWNQAGSQCYPICELLPEDWVEQDPS